ncbi:INS protein, partial [Polypterus senegalus]
MVFLQVFFLLVCLVLSPPQAANAAANGHRCSSDLMDALYLVCGDRGFFYITSKSKNDTESSFSFLTGKTGSETEIDGFPFKQQGLDKEKRSIVKQCCDTPCMIWKCTVRKAE